MLHSSLLQTQCTMLLQECVSIFLHWQHKLSTLVESSFKVVPVPLRTRPVDHYRPVTSLCDYKTEEVSLFLETCSLSVFFPHVTEVT